MRISPAAVSASCTRRFAALVSRIALPKMVHSYFKSPDVPVKTAMAFSLLICSMVVLEITPSSGISIGAFKFTLPKLPWQAHKESIIRRANKRLNSRFMVVLHHYLDCAGGRQCPPPAKNYCVSFFLFSTKTAKQATEVIIISAQEKIAEVSPILGGSAGSFKSANAFSAAVKVS